MLLLRPTSSQQSSRKQRQRRTLSAPRRTFSLSPSPRLCAFRPLSTLSWILRSGQGRRKEGEGQRPPSSFLRRRTRRAWVGSEGWAGGGVLEKEEEGISDAMGSYWRVVRWGERWRGFGEGSAQVLRAVREGYESSESSEGFRINYRAQRESAERNLTVVQLRPASIPPFLNSQTPAQPVVALAIPPSLLISPHLGLSTPWPPPRSSPLAPTSASP